MTVTDLLDQADAVIIADAEDLLNNLAPLENHDKTAGHKSRLRRCNTRTGT